LAEVEKFRMYLRFENDREEAYQRGRYYLTIHQGTKDSALSLSSKYHQDVWVL
jgi:hypothetical protein